MENNQRIAGITQIDDSYTEKWFSQKFSLVTGLYHLTYDGQWRCMFASNNCFQLLKCASSDFLESLQALSVRTDYHAAKKTVGTILHEITLTRESGSFICVRPWKDGELQYLKGILTVSPGQDGLLCVYGLLTDVSGEQARSVQSQDIEATYRAGMKMTGRSFYRYLVADRRGIIPPGIAKRDGIPEVIDDLPDWFVETGRIAPQSVEAWYGLFEAIEWGEKQGSADIILRLQDGKLLRRYQVEFVSTADKAGNPVSAVISYQDVTDEYKRNHQQALDHAGLLQIAQMAFPEIISMNLTERTYRIIQYYGATTLGTPREGPLDQMLLPRLSNVAPEDREAFRSQFFPEGQLKAIREGKERMQLTYRRRGADGVWHWMETTVVHQENPYDDDVLTFAVSHSIDEEKAKEKRLREQLRQQAEELKITMSQMGKHISYYDVPTGTLTTLPSTANEFGVPVVLENYPESFLASPPEGYPPESGELLRSFVGAIRRGEPTGACDYPTVTADGRKVWLHREFVTIFDDNQQPVRAVIASEDTTQSHTQTEENRKLKEQVLRNQQIFHIVAQHSNRILYSYDLKTGTTRPWNLENQKKDILSHMYGGNYSDGALDFNQFVLQDCIPDVKRFFADIHGGKPSGEVNVHVKLLGGQRRWYHFKYSSIYDGDQPVTALISIEDVTERHEHELAYLRHVQSVEVDAEGHLMYIESDLTDNRIENLSGQMLSEEERNMRCSHSEFRQLTLDLKFQYEDFAEAAQYFSIENLLRMYAQGKRQLRSEWKVRFHDGTQHWLYTETILMEDPYNGHVKAFFRMTDITKDQEERLAVIQRADYDSMTGLLRKDVGEERIRQHLAANNVKGGILIALDLDDLKGINDNLGHKQGDEAIIGISNTLKGHFRRDDILIRNGGDEFIVYLPGAGKSVNSVEIAMTALLRKLSGISVGENGERHIHCSAGCAVEEPGADTYDTLFKRADLALYHVKRSGKNNFAFYEPEMSQKDYEFRSKKLLSMKNIKKFDLNELQYLINAIATFYQLVLSVNLSANTYYMMEEVKDGVFARVPDFGALDGFIQLAAKGVHPDDVDAFLGCLSRDALLQTYGGGEENVRHYFRFHSQGKYRWIECMVIFYTNDQGDVCDFTMLRWADERTNELERLRVQKILELSAADEFEYVCLIDVRSKSYSTFRRGSVNSHAIPESADFDMVTKRIRDTQILPEAREAYYENATLEHVLQHMGETEDSYSYRYTMTDGITREAAFSWYEKSHSELLMTVRKIT